MNIYTSILANVRLIAKAGRVNSIINWWTHFLYWSQYEVLTEWLHRQDLWWETRSAYVDGWKCDQPLGLQQHVTEFPGRVSWVWNDREWANNQKRHQSWNQLTLCSNIMIGSMITLKNKWERIFKYLKWLLRKLWIWEAGKRISTFLQILSLIKETEKVFRYNRVNISLNK